MRKSLHEQTSEEKLYKRTKALAEQQAKSKGKSEILPSKDRGLTKMASPPQATNW